MPTHVCRGLSHLIQHLSSLTPLQWMPLTETTELLNIILSPDFFFKKGEKQTQKLGGGNERRACVLHNLLLNLRDSLLWFLNSGSALKYWFPAPDSLLTTMSQSFPKDCLEESALESQIEVVVPGIDFRVHKASTSQGHVTILAEFLSQKFYTIWTQNWLRSTRRLSRIRFAKIQWGRMQQNQSKGIFYNSYY